MNLPGLIAFPKGYFDDLCDGTRTLGSWIDEASTLGIDGVEMYPHFYQEPNRGAIVSANKYAHSKGLQTPMMCTSPDFTQHAKEERMKEIRSMRFWIDIMSETPDTGRVKSCRVLSGQRRPGISREDGIAWVTDAIEQLLPYAEEKGVHLVMENHYKDGRWTYPEFAQSLDIYSEIVDSIKSRWFGVNFDPSNALISGQDPTAVLRKFKDRVLTMHASDRHLRPGYTIDDLSEHAARGYHQALEHGVIGTGLIDYDCIFRTLKETGFSGWISIEDGVNGPEDLRNSIKFLKSIIGNKFGRH